MNSRNLDVYTKEELQLFYYQLSVSSVNFTICGIFSVNNSLFISAVTALATYTVMLVQFHSRKTKY
ncbi:gustatory receptor for sugar taste 43a-like [Sipha flava]|uniref:Gustatory receptor for sugar taste 43a-like n=2 Tax=Sipha flava TaxID=143950 RepID=A0A8B8GE24_9HEMI|nr:gustatory receptor for sugar taste 43a-like [Sipha flava]